VELLGTLRLRETHEAGNQVEVFYMSTAGQDVLLAINQVREFFEETGKLLATADTQMEQAGWKPAKGSAVTADMSWALQNPRMWMPHYLCRFYAKQEKPSLLASLCVLIGVFDQNDRDRLTQPLLIGSVFDYGGKKPDGWSMDYCNWHLYIPNRTDDGTVYRVDPRKQWPEDKCLAEELRSFALPLVDLSDANDLKSKVVTPLLKLTAE
jgi:hypothetical protein